MSATECLYVWHLFSLCMNFFRSHTAISSARSSSLPYLGKSPSISKSVARPSSSRTTLTLAYLIALRESTTCENPAIPVAKERLNVCVDQGHLCCLIVVFIMHVVDHVQCINIQLGQPLHHLVIFLHYFIVIKVLGSNWLVSRSYLLLCVFSSTPPLIA